MKALITVLALATSMATFAQLQQEPVLIDTFSSFSSFSDNAIHSITSVEIVKKVENNEVCLFGDPCEFYAKKDSILLKIKGTTESNMTGNNKLILMQNRIAFDWRNSSEVIALSLKGAVINPQHTLVFDNVAYAMWGGSMPFETQIEIHNDINEESETKEFRIATSENKIFRFSVTYADSAWTVKQLEEFSTRAELTGELAQKIIDLYPAEERFISGELKILTLPAQTPDSFVVNSDSQVVAKLDAELSNNVFAKLNSILKFHKEYNSLEFNCQKPNEYNELTEPSCQFR